MLYVIETKGFYHKSFLNKKNTDIAEGTSSPSAIPLRPSRWSGNQRAAVCTLISWHSTR